MFKRLAVVLVVLVSSLGLLGGVAIAAEDGGHDMTDMTTKKSTNKKNSDEMKMSGHMSGNAKTVEGAREIAVTGDAFAFTPQEIALRSGEEVTIVLTASDIAHDFMVQGVGHIVSAKRMKTAEGGLRIDKPGTYRFWCAEKGHRKSGMTGTIVVT